ncbi:MAG: ATP-binding protein [Nocardioides sp.]
MVLLGGSGSAVSGPDDAATLDLLPDGVVLADGDGVVRLINVVAERQFGIDRGDGIGKPLDQVLALRDRDGAEWVTTNCPYGGLQLRSGIPEQAWFLPNGHEVLVTARLSRPALLAGQPPGPDPRPVTAVAIVLRSGRGRARLDRDRSDLVATVAHELRSPLTGVKGFVQALLNRWDKLSDEQRKLMLSTVNADAERLTRLIAELLDVARLDTGRLSLYCRPSDAGTLTSRVVESVRAGTSRPVELLVADDLPSIWVDVDKFTQVVTNLIDNAVRHGEGIVRVAVSAPSGDGADTGVRITIDDEGEGIPEEIRRRVFTKFWTHGVRGGTGLGMYLVNGLVRAHGGTVRIDQAPGGGARIIVLWPVEAPESAQDPHEE